jgi:hypothetical protein
MVVIVVIVAVALFLIVLAFVDRRWLEKRAETKKEPSYIQQVREAAFAVIEASLEAEPDKWEVQLLGAVPEYLVCRKNSLAIYIGNGPERLFVLDGRSLQFGTVRLSVNNADKMTPSERMAQRIYDAAMAIARGQVEKIELARLEQMVSAFGEVVHREKTHDTKAAGTSSLH